MSAEGNDRSNTTVTDQVNSSTGEAVYSRSEKEQKLDRQLRLWGQHGQARLDVAQVCILGSNATACELAKNLILPNIGSVTLIDDAIVSRADGANFFVPRASHGQPRAEVAAAALLELNPDIVCTGVSRSAAELVDKDLASFRVYSCVVLADDSLDLDRLHALAAFLYPLNIPFLHVSTNGFLGYVRLAVQELRICENHAENDRADLYVTPAQLDTWPELKEFVDSFDMKALEQDSRAHSHVPYLVIIAHKIREWQLGHGGAMPGTYEEKRAFKASIEQGRLASNTDGEENYDEAVEFAHRAYLPPSLDADTQRVFEDQRGQEASLDDKSELFWICVAATNRFRASEGQGLYPASASLPDMTSDTKYFVALGELFKAKAKQDCAAVLAHANALVASLSWEQSTQQQVAEYVAYFVKHVRWLRVVGTSSLAQEYAPETFNATAATEYFEEVDYEAPPDAPAKPNMIHWYMAFRAAFSFSQHYGRWPGAAAEHVDADAKQLAETAHELITAASVESGAVDARVMTEFTRYGGKEMHTTASAVGGIASQVVLKVLLSQFVPVNSTIMYNGIHAQCAMLEL